jgi:hypothetical protein
MISSLQTLFTVDLQSTAEFIIFKLSVDQVANIDLR